ncbi:hypothetical protein ACFLSW_04960 [Candidatus Bipolaricaulota bacterium]
MNRNARQTMVLELLVVMALCQVSTIALADCTCIDDDCYEDVVVSGAGEGASNGLYQFTSMSGSRPRYVAANLYDIIHAPPVFNFSGGWVITDGGYVRYWNSDGGPTPPANGWEPEGGAPPAPTLSGGQLCPPPKISGTPNPALTASTYTFIPKVRDGHGPFVFTIVNQPPWADFDPVTGQLSGRLRHDDIGVDSGIIVTVTDAHNRSDTLGPFSIEVVSPFHIIPLGAAGTLLDRGIDRSADTETVSNSFRIFDSDGNPTCGVPMHVCVYEIDYSTSPSTRTLVEYRFVPCNPLTKRYEYEIPSYAMESPNHDVVLSFSDEPALDWPNQPLGTGPILARQSPSGEQPIAAVFEVGELITGRCRILDLAGLPIVTSYIHVYIYSLDASTRPATNSLISHWVIRCASGTLTYDLEFETSELSPGDYSIHLVFEDGSTQDIRIQLDAPAA